MAAPISLAFRIAANLTELRANLQQAMDQIETTASSMKRMANSLDGSSLIANANAMVKVVGDLGGVSKLTADEQIRVNDVVTQAIAKYEALGKTAPSALTALADATKQTSEATSGMLGWLQALGSSWVARIAEGQLLRDAVRELLSVLKDAVMAFPDLLAHTIQVGDSLYTMSLKTGASVESLSALRYVASQTGIDFDAFGNTLFKMEKFLGSTGAAAEQAQKHLDVLHLSLQTLKNEKPEDAFINIISALEAIPNRADQAAAGAAIFGKGFKDMAGLASENIHELIEQANQLGLVMSTETAAAAHAAAVGFNSLEMQLDAVGMRIGAAFLPAIIGLEQNIGTVLHESIEQTNASLAKMGGDGGFFATVARAMGTGNAAIAAQVTLYEDLRDALISVVRNGIEPALTAGSFLLTEFDASRVLLQMVVSGYQAITYAIEGLAKGFLMASQIINPSEWFGPMKTMADHAIGAISKDMDRLYDSMAQSDAKVQQLKKSEQDWADGAKSANAQIETALNKLGATHTDVAAIIAKFAKASHDAYGGVGNDIETASKSADTFAKKLAQLTETINAANTHGVPIAEQVKEYGQEAAKVAEEAQTWGLKVAASVQTVADAWNSAHFADLILKANEQLRAQAAKTSKSFFDDMVKDNKMAFDDLQKASGSNLDVMTAAAADARKLIDKTNADTLEGQIAAISAEADARRAGLNANGRDYQDALAQVDNWEVLAAQHATDAWKAHMDAVRQQANSYSNIFRDALKDVPGIIQAALSGNGSGALASLSGIGSKLGGKAFGDLAAKLSNTFASTFGIGVTSALGTIFPGIGAAIGALAGPLITKIINLFGTAGRDAVSSFAASHGGFDVLHQQLAQLGQQGEQLWINLTQGVGRNNPQQAQAAIDAITKALQGQSDYLSRLPDEMQKYGLSWEQAGHQAEQAHLDTIAQGLIQDFADLTKAGFDVTLVTTQMSGAIDDYIHEALKTGTEVPAAMQPLLQKMADLGTLTDANGNVISDLSTSGIVFAKTMTQGFDEVTDAIKQLTLALTGPGGVGDALDSVGNRHYQPTISPKIEIPDGVDTGGFQVPTASTGGMVGYGKILHFASGGFVPQGTDTQPAMLTPGEMVLNKGEQANLAAALKGTGGNTYITVNVEGSLVQQHDFVATVTAAVAKGAREGGPTRTTLRDALGIRA